MKPQINTYCPLTQTVETPIEAFFKPLAYCLILLREQGYPCVFYGDLYGMKGENPEDPACGGSLSNIILARHLYAYGSQDVSDALSLLFSSILNTFYRTTGTTPTVLDGSATAPGTNLLVAPSFSPTPSLGA